jgi:hypothetical protein
MATNACILILDEKINFENESWKKTSIAQKPFSVSVNDIALVSGVTRLVGDDDCDFLILTDINENIFPINFSKPIDGWDVFWDIFKERFGIEQEWWNSNSSEIIVIYPNILYGEKLFSDTFVTSFFKKIGIQNFFNGKFSKKVTQLVAPLPRSPAGNKE